MNNDYIDEYGETDDLNLEEDWNLEEIYDYEEETEESEEEEIEWKHGALYKILTASNLSSQEKVFLSFLVLNAVEKTADYSLLELARMLNISAEKLKKIVARLEKRGYYFKDTAHVVPHATTFYLAEKYVLQDGCLRAYFYDPFEDVYISLENAKEGKKMRIKTKRKER